MMNVSNRSLLPFVRRRMNHLVIVGILSVGAVVSGLVPQVSTSLSGLSVQSVAVAQSPNPQISNYARAALRVEQLRQRMYTEAKEKLGGNVPTNVCSQQPPPEAVRSICSEFMRQSKEIIVEYLTISEFNDLTRRKESDPALQQQIQSELLRIQKSSP